MRYVVLFSVLVLAGCAGASKPLTSDRPVPSANGVEESEGNDPDTEIGNGLTAGQIDIFRGQIEKCWNVPYGASNPKDLTVVVRIEVNRDRTIKKLNIVDSERMKTDSYFRAMAESVRKALSHRHCKYLELPPEKYEVWKEITLTFDPTLLVQR